MKRRTKSGRWLTAGVILTATVFLLAVIVATLFPPWHRTVNYSAATAVLPPALPVVRHQSTPEPLRALYLTQCAAASPTLREHLLRLATTTEINAIVVDLKDYSGTTVFSSTTALPGGGGCTYYSGFADLVRQLHEREIYVIGRLTVFQDPVYTARYPSEAVGSRSSGGVWRDKKGLSFVDVSSASFRKYIVALAREAYDLGVDEINFDYIRYPSDGNMADAKYLTTGFSKAESLERFFIELTAALREPVLSTAGHSEPLKLSADLFGMTATNYDDLNIGQVLERTLPYFDFVAPMVYPSHYPPRFNGWPDPNAVPYDIIYYSLSRAVERTTATTTPVASLAYTPITYASTSSSTLPAPHLYSKPAYPAGKIRPWLQDFDYPVAYTPAMVKAQIQATYDVGLTSWMLWDPRNEYTPSVLELTTPQPPPY